MAVPELRDRSPRMMTLISTAVTGTFVYSLATVVFPTQSALVRELVSLIDIISLGHWIELWSGHRASSTVDELAKLTPDTAERITESGNIDEIPVNQPSEGDLVLVQ